MDSLKLILALSSLAIAHTAPRAWPHASPVVPVTVTLHNFTNPESKLLNGDTCAGSTCQTSIYWSITAFEPYLGDFFGGMFRTVASLQMPTVAADTVQYGPSSFQPRHDNPFIVNSPLGYTVAAFISVYDLRVDELGETDSSSIFTPIGFFSYWYDTGAAEKTVTLQSGSAAFTVTFRTNN